MPRKSASKRARPRKGKRKSNTVQRAGPNPVLNPHVRSTYRPMPREFSVAMIYKYYDKRVNHSGPSSFVFGLFEFLNQKPMFTTEFFGLYRLARITAVHIRAESINMSSTVPLILAVGTLPWSAATSTFDPYLIAERPRSQSRIVATSTGMSRSIINKTYFSFDELGNPVYDTMHYFNSAQASATTPQDQEAPCVIVSVNSADATSNWDALTTYTVTYHVQWFEPQWADFSEGLHDKSTVHAEREISPDYPEYQDFVVRDDSETHLDRSRMVSGRDIKTKIGDKAKLNSKVQPFTPKK